MTTKKKKPKLSVTIVEYLNLYYVRIEESGEELRTVGPFRDSAAAEAERDRQKKSRKKSS